MICVSSIAHFRPNWPESGARLRGVSFSGHQ
jgi:hypothetical protein